MPGVGKMPQCPGYPESCIVRTRENAYFQMDTSVMADFKVYISSTYADLKDHREAVRDYFGKFRDKFEVISMEDYVAGSEPPADVCIRDVKRCDFYILIFSNRYGFIPENSDTIPNPEKRSVTHMEYITARDNKKKVFAFFPDDKAGFKPDADEIAELRQLKETSLAKFKQEVRSKYLTHPEGFISAHQLALMISESMQKAEDFYDDIATKKDEHFMETQIHPDRIYCLNRIRQYNEFLNVRINTNSPFKAIISHGPKDMLVESLQKRITEITLSIPKANIYKTTVNGIFGSCTDYESCKLTFLNAAFQQLFKQVTIGNGLKDINELAQFLNEQDEDIRVAFIVQWSKLIDGENDPRIPLLNKLVKEFHDACKGNNCIKIYFFLNIDYKSEDEQAFTSVIKMMTAQNPPGAPYLFALEKPGKVASEDLELWVENYVTDVSFKVNRIIDTYLPDLDDASMQAAEEKMYKFIKKVNAKDEEAINLLK
jgi:hypothetical protein